MATDSGGKIGGEPDDMATDGDGNVWVTDSDGVVRVNTAAAPTFDDFIVAGASGREIALGGDGRMWWADFGGNAIQATTTAGVTTKATDLTSGAQGIAAGPGHPDGVRPAEQPAGPDLPGRRAAVHHRHRRRLRASGSCSARTAPTGRRASPRTASAA